MFFVFSFSVGKIYLFIVCFFPFFFNTIMKYFRKIRDFSFPKDDH
jgi:hypothetical protein